VSWFLNYLLVPALVYGCTYALVATGFNVLERSTRVLNFAHGYLIMWAPMATLVLSAAWGVPPIIGLLGGVLVAIILGLLVEVIAIRPFVGKADVLPWILSTLGASLVLGQLALLPFKGEARAFPYALSLSPGHFGIVQISPQQMLLFGVTVLVALAIYTINGRTRLGKMLTAVAEDFDGSRVLGISPTRMAQAAMIGSAVVAAATGMLIAPFLLVSPDLGFNLTFTGFVAAALGGLGSLRGGFLGGIAVGFVIQLTAIYLGSVWTNTALFAVLLLVLLVRPWGLLGQAPARQV
jgi:branched-chain amino acid transport system permease protein